MEKLIFKNSRGQSITLGNTGPFLLEKIDGTGSPQTTILTSKAPGQDGKSHHGTLLEERIIPITGSIIGDTAEDMYRKRQQLCSILNPKVPGKLTYINDARSYEIDYTVQDLTPKDKVSELQEFLLQLYCPNPFWTDIQESKEEVALWVGDFSFEFEIPQDGIEMGHRESNLIVNMFNEGDVECGVRIEFTALATVVNPSLLNIYTQEYIKVKRTLQAGDKLIISTNFGSKKVELIRYNIAMNVFNYIDLNSTFLQLQVGDNVLKYDAESGIDNLEMSIYYKPLYIGA